MEDESERKIPASKLFYSHLNTIKSRYFVYGLASFRGFIDGPMTLISTFEGTTIYVLTASQVLSTINWKSLKFLDYYFASKSIGLSWVPQPTKENKGPWRQRRINCLEWFSYEKYTTFILLIQTAMLPLEQSIYLV